MRHGSPKAISLICGTVATGRLRSHGAAGHAGVNPMCPEQEAFRQFCSLIRIDQRCLAKSGGFAPISFPLFQGVRFGEGRMSCDLAWSSSFGCGGGTVVRPTM